MRKKRIKSAEEARQFAIDWQQWQSEQDLSYGEVAGWNYYFEGLVKQFPELKEEFQENAII